MSSKKPGPDRKTRSRTHQHITRWHRYLGLTGIVFILILAVTGLMLNHTSLLRLDSRYVHSEWLLDWYDIEAPAEMISYRAGDHWVTQLGDQIFLDERKIPELGGVLTGALAMDDLLVIGFESALALVTSHGLLIERLTPASGAPAGMTRLGTVNAGGLVVDTGHGKYIADADFLEWREFTTRVSSLPLQVIEITWAEPQTPPPELKDAVATAYRTTILPLERIVLDIHGGPFVGAWGRYLVDAVGVLIIVLALFGLWIWAARRQRGTHDK